MRKSLVLIGVIFCTLFGMEPSFGNVGPGAPPGAWTIDSPAASASLPHNVTSVSCSGDAAANGVTWICTISQTNPVDSSLSHSAAVTGSSANDAWSGTVSLQSGNWYVAAASAELKVDGNVEASSSFSFYQP